MDQQITFAGPWTVTVADEHLGEGPLTLRLRFIGTSGGDMDVDDPQAGFRVDADGADWAIALEGLIDAQPPIRAPLLSVHTFERARGWIVDIHTGDDLPPQFYNQHARMHLQCVCRDPEVQPLPAEPLYDFSIPEGRHG
ncbi:MAG: hypothetical protein H7Y19_03560 [Luteimonas sp.]|nr:hypothetical protein [Luteimonas sp.]